MAGQASAELEPRQARGQIKFVVDDQQVGRRNLQIAQQLPYRGAALIHVAGGFGQPHGLLGAGG